MSKKLTTGQRKARAVIKAAARQMLKEVDQNSWRRDCIEFTADFHLACIRYDRATAFGKPCATSWPIYVSRFAR